MKPLTFSQAIDGYILETQAERLSKNTIRNYQLTFRRFTEWLADPQHSAAPDPPLETITSRQISQFLADLANPRPLPGVAPRPDQGLSKKTALNYHGALSALWAWAVREKLVSTNIVISIPRPIPEKRVVVAFSHDDLKALLAACGRSRAYKRPGKRECDNERATAERDRAIILLLLDTGMRAGELTGLHIRDVDLKNRRLIVFGKGAKERLLPFSAPTGKQIWRYLQTERDQPADSQPLFVTDDGAPMTENALFQLIKRLGTRAAVPDAHPHRFRHTFAIMFLRNGGNAYELQKLLGHTTLEMVRQYLSLAQTDVEAAHRRASPVEGWRLGTTR